VTYAIDVKDALKTAIGSLPEIAEFEQVWGFDGDPEYISIMLGNITWEDTEWNTNRAQVETFQIKLVIVVSLLASDSEESEKKANSIYQVIAAWVKDHPGLNVDQVISSRLAPVSLLSGPWDDKYQAQFEAAVIVKARIP
jgi:hypothetical protein